MAEIKRTTISPQAMELAKKHVLSKAAPLYPFDDLQVNESFTVPLADANLQSLQVITSRKSKNGKKFLMVKHEELTPQLVEIARIL